MALPVTMVSFLGMVSSLFELPDDFLLCLPIVRQPVPLEPLQPERSALSAGPQQLRPPSLRDAEVQSGG